jgi:LmbE family N-acetylglucosaminyl deacetylase
MAAVRAGCARLSFAAIRSLLAGGLLLPAAVLAAEPVAAPRPAFLSPGPIRVLVISPHPDDATLGAGGLIQRVTHLGGTIRVVQMTGGDAFPHGVTAIWPRTRPTELSYRWYGSLREREAVRAMRQMGIHRSQIRLLGFPDEGLCVLASADRSGTAFQSPYTKRESPPDSEQIVTGTLYRGDDLVRELARLIDEFRPTLLVLPHPGDEHPDHCASHLLAHQALAAAHAGPRPPRVLHYIIHYRTWPMVDSPAEPLAPPSGSLMEQWQWRTLTLTDAERTAKRLALDAFRSQMLVMPDFLRAFERPNELFIEGEPLRPVPCWCGGENITAAGSRIP